jgi:ferredoxin-NADP reductase
MNYAVKLLDCKTITEKTVTFYLEKPEGFEFQAGQFCSMTFPDIGFKDEMGLRRPLSIASSPLEEELFFVTKVSNSAFKKTLKEMPIGTEVTIGAPHGLFGLTDDATVPIVFLAAGIGIAPFLSMVRYAAAVPTKHAITLFYSNRTPEEAIFLEELQNIAGTHENIVLVATMTRVPESDKSWNGLRGRISQSMVKDNCGEWHSALYYIAGPPGMVGSMKEMLVALGIQSERIKLESFAGA